MLINGLDAKQTYGFGISEAPSWIDLPPRTTPTQAVLQKQGVVVTAAPVEGPRRLVLRGYVSGASAAAARANVDSLKLAFLAPLVQLTFDDSLTRYITVGLDNFTIGFAGTAFIDRKLKVEIQLTAYDPYFYETTVTNIASAAAMVLGTGLVRPIITITATGTNAGPILIVLRTNDNVVVGTLTVNVGLVSTDILIVDMDARTVKKNGATVLGLVTAGDFWLADPSTHIQAGVGPKVDAVTNATVNVAFRKTWR